MAIRIPGFLPRPQQRRARRSMWMHGSEQVLPWEIRHDYLPPMIRERVGLGVTSTSTVGCSYFGSDAFGRPVKQYNMPGEKNPTAAIQQANSYKAAGRDMWKSGRMPFYGLLIGEPGKSVIRSLARGESVVLRWQNGTTVSVSP